MKTSPTLSSYKTRKENKLLHYTMIYERSIRFIQTPIFEFGARCLLFIHKVNFANESDLLQGRVNPFTVQLFVYCRSTSSEPRKIKYFKINYYVEFWISFDEYNALFQFISGLLCNRTMDLELYNLVSQLRCYSPIFHSLQI